MKCVNQRQHRAATVPKNCRPSNPTPPTPPPAFNLVVRSLSVITHTHQHNIQSVRGVRVAEQCGEKIILLFCLVLFYKKKRERKKELGSQTGAHR